LLYFCAKTHQLNENLNKLIKHYKKERKRYKKLFKGEVIEAGYLYKDYYEEKYFDLCRKLSLLKNFRRDEKSLFKTLLCQRKMRMSHIQRWKKRRSKRPYFTIPHSYLQKLEEVDKAMLDLPFRKKPMHIDSQVIDDLIHELIEGKIQEIKLPLNNYENISLVLSIEKENIKIKTYSFSDKNIRDYKSKWIQHAYHDIGFRVNHQTDEMEYFYPLKDFKTSIPIKIIIAKVYFEIYYRYYGFRKENQTINVEVI